MEAYNLMKIFAKVGAIVSGDGTENQLRGSQSGALIVQQAHGVLNEAAFRRKLFYSYCPALAMGLAHTTAIGNILWNPPNSGVNAHLHKWFVMNNVTDTDAVAFLLGYSPQITTPSGATASTTGCNFLGAATGFVKAYSAATITTAVTPIIALARITVAVNVVGLEQNDGDFQGGLVIPPGVIVHVHCVAAAGTAGTYSTLWWEEVPIVQ